MDRHLLFGTIDGCYCCLMSIEYVSGLVLCCSCKNKMGIERCLLVFTAGWSWSAVKTLTYRPECVAQLVALLFVPMLPLVMISTAATVATAAATRTSIAATAIYHTEFF